MKTLLVFDRDGTLTYNQARPGDYINCPSEIAAYPEALARFQEVPHDWDVAIASNQGGIDKQYISLDACVQGFRRTMELFPRVSLSAFCPEAYPARGDGLWAVYPRYPS